MRFKEETSYTIEVRVTTSEGHLFLERSSLERSHQHGQTIYRQVDGWGRLSWEETLSSAKKTFIQMVKCMSIHNGARAEVRIIRRSTEEVECIHLT